MFVCDTVEKSIKAIIENEFLNYLTIRPGDGCPENVRVSVDGLVDGPVLVH